MRDEVLRFVFQEGWAGIRRGPFHSFVVIAATALAVGVLGFFYYGGLNLQNAARTLLQQLQFEAFVAPSLPESQHQGLLASLKAIDPRWKIEYISREEAAARFRREFDPMLFDVLKINPLPASFQITLPQQVLNVTDARAVAQRLQELDGIDEVVYDQELLALYQNGRAKLAFWGTIAGILAVLLALALTYNAIRLKIDHQRESIRLMSLMGATPWMLRGVYWLQGTILGFVGGLIGTGLLASLAVLIETRLSANLHLIGPSLLLCALAGGVLGVLGGVLSVGRYLKL